MDAIARDIAADIDAGRPFRLFPALDAGPGAMDRAYAVQDALTLLRGGPMALAGYKLAFNGAASRDYYGLTEGCIAPIYTRDIRHDGAVLHLADFHSLVIEPEICLELGADLEPGPGLTTVKAMAAVAAIRPAVEVMDHRGAFALDPSAAQAVAQGVHTAGAVLGATVSPDVLALRHTITTRLMLAEAEVGARADGAPQDPAEALVWAAEALSRRGLALRAGMILMCGTHLPVQAITTPCAVRAEMGAFGTVGFSVV
jgi:2-keto-4-pentenoate hydratase